MENKEIGEGMLKVSNIAVSLDEKDYAKVIANTLNIRKSQVKNVKIAKKAVDARRKNNILIWALLLNMSMKINY